MKLYLISYKHLNQYSVWTKCPSWNPSLHSFSSDAKDLLGMVDKKLFNTLFHTYFTCVRDELFEVTFSLDKSENRVTLTDSKCIMGV